MKVRKNLVQLYLSYHPVFLRANALLLENGGQAVNLKGLTLKGVTLQVNHALSNEDWGLDFGRQADKLRDFIDKTVDAAAALKGQLNLLKDQQDLLTNAGQ